MARQGENFLGRISQALCRPILSRCAELTVLFDRGNIKDLQTIFPLLIDDIFGPQGRMSWGLRMSTAAANPQEFCALQHFFSPLGPMFKLIYALLRDPQIKYEFSLGYLPTRTRQSLDSTHVHPFYGDLLDINHQTKQVSLLLNPFDYYMFHFAYHLINPWHQRTLSAYGATWSTVYYTLCCDYLLHFLPTNPNCQVLPQINIFFGKSPVQTLPSYSRPVKTSKLLRANVLTDVVNDMGNLHQSLEYHPRNETWRSETVVIAFIDMWLNNDQVIQVNPGFNITPTQPTFQFNELPTGEYIRIVRVLVKQFHSFASSGKADDTHMFELKKVVVPMMQGKMYIFLRNLVHRWPLDGSFRMVLELWLSFIQPWRYPGNEYLRQQNQQDLNSEVEDINTAPMKAVDREYMIFIAENLLAYVVIFQQLLPRFSRIDLASPKNSLMLYRLAKVFSQPNLITLLRETESCIQTSNSSPAHTYSTPWTSILPPLSPTTNWSSNTFKQYNSALSSSPKKGQLNLNSPSNNSSLFDQSFNFSASKSKWSNIVKQKIYELEGPNFCYKPLFTTSAPPEVYDLTLQLKKAQECAQSVIQERLDAISQRNSGFFGFMRSIFLSMDEDDEFTLDERKKVPIYLEYALQNIIDMFEMGQVSDVTSQQSLHSNREPQYNNDIKYLLTPERVRERVKNIKYEGDPDLYPVRSNEIKFLVRTLYQLALKVNEKYRSQLNVFYYKQNYLGKLCRQVLYPPITIYKYDKSQAGRSPRISERLPPRISFRYFAAQKFWAYLIVGAVFSNLLGYQTSAFLFVVGIICFIYVCLKALFHKENDQYSYSPTNLNFNESF